ncbi:MAG: protein YpfM [Citrobacter freundii]|nr:protein YpfM [Citrobacter freundii]
MIERELGNWKDFNFIEVMLRK